MPPFEAVRVALVPPRDKASCASEARTFVAFQYATPLEEPVPSATVPEASGNVYVLSVEERSATSKIPYKVGVEPFSSILSPADELASAIVNAPV